MPYLKDNEGYIVADKMNWWIPTETSWKCGPGRAWSMLERQQTGLGPTGEPLYSYTLARKQVHWLFGIVAEKPDPDRGPIPESVNMVAWHC